MAEPIVQVSLLPEGWKTITDRSGNEQRTRLALEVGDLSVLLKKALKTRWRFNLLTNRIELDGVAVPVAEIDQLYVALSERGYKIDQSKAKDAAKTAAMANAFHPVADYLNKLASDGGIAAVDLNSLATTYWETTDPLYDAMVKATLIGAVRRIYEPGCSRRNVLVFKGWQDVGKSQAIIVLASPAWHSDTHQENHKDFLMAIHGCWIFELAELDSIVSKKQAGTLKNDISSPKDFIRVPYSSSHDWFPRQSIFMGTSNRSDFLRDETGSSRFWVVELPHDADAGFVVDLKRLLKDRDGIWKAAVEAYRQGESDRLTFEEQAESNRRNLSFEVDHPWEDTIAEWLDKAPDPWERPDPFTSEECFYLSGCAGNPIEWRHSRADDFFKPLDQKVAVEVGKILRRLGYQKDKHQSSGKSGKKRRWRPSGASRRRTTPEAGQTPASDSDPGKASQVSTPFHQKDLNQGEPVAAAAVVGKTPERSERGGCDFPPLEDFEEWFFG